MLTIKDAAAYLSVKESTIRGWTVSGKLKSTRNERGWALYDEGDLDNMRGCMKKWKEPDLKKMRPVERNEVESFLVDAGWHFGTKVGDEKSTDRTYWTTQHRGSEIEFYQCARDHMKSWIRVITKMKVFCAPMQMVIGKAEKGTLFLVDRASGLRIYLDKDGAVLRWKD